MEEIEEGKQKDMVENEWKELKIDNLPPDILTGGYKFEKEYDAEHKIFLALNWRPIEILRDLYEGEARYRYRKPEPKTPTHEEIMTKWWKTEKRGWQRVTRYFESGIGPYYIDAYESSCAGRLDKNWFTNRQSADIPPEN